MIIIIIIIIIINGIYQPESIYMYIIKSGAETN